MDNSKFEKCLRLTESTNEHEALLALRTAQKLGHSSKINFTDYILNQKQSYHSASSVRELNAMRERLERVIRESNEWSERCQELFTENKKLKKKLEAFKGSKTLQKKYKELKEDLEFTEDSAQFADEQLNIFHHVYDCNKNEKNDALKELVQDFIKKKYIKISEKDFILTTELYRKFKGDICHDVDVMSIKKFSQIFAALLNIKPIKGGPKKDRMGFKVYIYPF